MHPITHLSSSSYNNYTNFRCMGCSSSQFKNPKPFKPPSPPSPPTPLSISITTQFTIPLSQIPSVTINGVKKVADGFPFRSKDVSTVKQDPNYKYKLRANAKSVRTHRSLSSSGATMDSLQARSEATGSTSYPRQPTITNVPIINPSRLRVLHDSNDRKNQSVGDSNVGTYGDSDVNGLLKSSPFHLMLGFERNKFDAKLEEWKETEMDKLINRLRKKEAEISELEIKEITRARIHLKKIKSKLERRRKEATKQMEMEISRVQKKAEERKAQERRFTAMQLSEVSKFVEKVTVTGKLPWWKSLFKM